MLTENLNKIMEQPEINIIVDILDINFHKTLRNSADFLIPIEVSFILRLIERIIKISPNDECTDWFKSLVIEELSK